MEPLDHPTSTHGQVARDAVHFATASLCCSFASPEFRRFGWSRWLRMFFRFVGHHDPQGEILKNTTLTTKDFQIGQFFHTHGFAFCTNQRRTELSAEFSKPPLTLSEARLVERTLTGATVSDVSPKNYLHFLVVIHEVCSWLMVFNQSLKSLRMGTPARFYPLASNPKS